jgi:flagellar protein FlaG
MPTEVTTKMSQTQSHVAENSRVQQQSKVIVADKVVARQGLSENEQSVPLAKESSQPSSQQLEQAAENLNQHVQSLKRDLHFSVNEDTGETVITVVDSQSQKMIRTIPSEEFVSMSQQLNLTVGMLLNAQA